MTKGYAHYALIIQFYQPLIILFVYATLVTICRMMLALILVPVLCAILYVLPALDLIQQIVHHVLLDIQCQQIRFASPSVQLLSIGIKLTVSVWIVIHVVPHVTVHLLMSVYLVHQLYTTQLQVLALLMLIYQPAVLVQ